MAAPEARNGTRVQRMAASGDADASAATQQVTPFCSCCQCARPTANDASAQTEQGPTAEEPEPSCGEGACEANSKDEVNENRLSIPHADKPTSTAEDGAASAHRYQAVDMNNLDSLPEASKTEESVMMKEDSRYFDSRPEFLGEENPDSSSLASSRTRQLVVGQSKTEDVILEAEAGAEVSTMTESVLESVEKQEEQNRDPCLDDRRFLVKEEFGAIMEHVESRWDELCAELRGDLGSRHNLFLAECGYCLENESSDPKRNELRQKMASARRELMASMADEFRVKCGEFNDWCDRYMQSELRNLKLARQQSERYRVLATAIRYEIINHTPDVQEDLRKKAAAIWKALAKQMELDMETLFKQFF